MFKLKYNILVIIQMVLGIINYVLLLRIFSVSIESDAYLLATSSILVFYSLVSLPIFQVIPYYNELKTKSVKQSQDFYNSLIFFAFSIGILFFLIISVCLPVIAKFFVLGLDNDRFELFQRLLKILSFCIIFYPVNQINEQLFNAEMKYSLPYILSCIPLALITITQCIMIYYNSFNIEYLAIAQSIGYFFISIFGTLYISQTLIKLKFVKWHYALKNEIKNSITLKLGDFGWGIAIPMLFNNFLSMLPKGYTSYFYYAKKIMDIANNITIGPAVKILRSNISKLIAKFDVPSIVKIAKSFWIYGGLIYISTIVLAYYLQVPILKLVTSNNLSAFDLTNISSIFLSLIPWYFIMFVEIPFSAVTHMSKKAKETLFINMMFLVFFAPLLFILGRYFGIYSIGISIFLAQISNLILYIYVSKKCLTLLKKEKKNERI